MHQLFLLTSLYFLNGNPIFWGNYTKEGIMLSEVSKETNGMKWVNCLIKFSWKRRSSSPEVFLWKGVLEISSKFTGYHPCRSVILLKLLSNFIEIVLQYGCSLVSLLHILEHLVTKIPGEDYFWKLNIYFWNLLGNPDIYTAWKVSAFRVIQVRIFQHSDQKNFECSHF